MSCSQPNHLNQLRLGYYKLSQLLPVIKVIPERNLFQFTSCGFLLRLLYFCLCKIFWLGQICFIRNYNHWQSCQYCHTTLPEIVIQPNLFTLKPFLERCLIAFFCQQDCLRFALLVRENQHTHVHSNVQQNLAMTHLYLRS